jgi:hypothetical protein
VVAGAAPCPVAFFSRNFLLMFTAANFLACATGAGPGWPGGAAAGGVTTGSSGGGSGLGSSGASRDASSFSAVGGTGGSVSPWSCAFETAEIVAVSEVSAGDVAMNRRATSRVEVNVD